MKTSKFAVLACILVCTFLAAGFADSASAASTVKVTVNPKRAAILLGGSQQFTAKVSGVQNATVTWSLDATSLANGCTISTSGLVTVPTTITPDSFTPVVTATYTGGASPVSGTATFTITDPSPAPGLFLGSITCTQAPCSGEGFHLAMNLKNGGKIDGLVLEGNQNGYITFTTSINLRSNMATVTYTLFNRTFRLSTQIEYTNGTVGALEGDLWVTGVVDPVGSWAIGPTTTGLAKTGTFKITNASIFGRTISGQLAGMTPPASTNTFYGVVVVPSFNHFTAPVDGTYNETSGQITFDFDITTPLGIFSIHGTGTASANGVMSGILQVNGVDAGTWTLHDL